MDLGRSKNIPQHKYVKASQYIQKVLNGQIKNHSLKIGCKKCHGRGYVGVNQTTGLKAICSCMFKQIDYAQF